MYQISLVFKIVLLEIQKLTKLFVEMADGSTVINASGIHLQAIKLANGEWYDGSNDN